jgi:hypothetical protein
MLKRFAVKRELERWGVRSTAKRVKIRDLYTGNDSADNVNETRGEMSGGKYDKKATNVH